MITKWFLFIVNWIYQKGWNFALVQDFEVSFWLEVETNMWVIAKDLVLFYGLFFLNQIYTRLWNICWYTCGSFLIILFSKKAKAKLAIHASKSLSNDLVGKNHKYKIRLPIN